MASKHTVKVGRVYDGRAWGDGNRVLVDRLWPRGLATVDVDLDEWCKQVAPPTTLRAWYATIRNGSSCSLSATGQNWMIPNMVRRWTTSAALRSAGTSPCSLPPNT
jgi:hypothetical protein